MQPEKGIEIKGLTSMFMMPVAEGPMGFCGAIQEKDGKAVTTGGRNLTIVGKGSSIAEANRSAYDVIKRKNFRNLWYRDDIGNAYFC